MTRRREISTPFESYWFSGDGAGWIDPESGTDRAAAGGIRNTDEFLFALALTAMVFGAVTSIALAARMEAFL